MILRTTGSKWRINSCPVAAAHCLHRIYIELADQYKVIDPVTNVAKRNVLAEHLREVIDILEQKVCAGTSQPNIDIVLTIVFSIFLQ